ncbi:hypothetical protein SAMN05216600_1327 [Pseudomonas cuatrocienegasensis]|uniref:Uncharacterized protein n=1 Tax=Pseudomonas cuatrocienegasensis TaxID=543360 RepID=A0ABY1BRL3_9PSED|nr:MULTISPECIES: hypothetical protein [Pseudomonas]OEC32672.1 hypothetical protein A7D25_22875 [Pseudomonas sp. 21C1]SER45978.1 hypothetical protein SAMN05216600_1327 [Pseudomonas cuatrocienegasensis]
MNKYLGTSFAQKSVGALLLVLVLSGCSTPLSSPTDQRRVTTLSVSLALLIDDKAFVGDLVRGALLNTSKPARHFYMCALQRNDQDIATLLSHTAITTWYTGHMGPLPRAAVQATFK